MSYIRWALASLLFRIGAAIITIEAYFVFHEETISSVWLPFVGFASLIAAFIINKTDEKKHLDMEINIKLDKGITVAKVLNGEDDSINLTLKEYSQVASILDGIPFKEIIDYVESQGYHVERDY